MASPLFLVEPSLDLKGVHRIESYQFQELHLPDHLRAYDQILQQSYESLGFLCEKILPCPNTQRYGITLQDELVGICSLTPVAESSNVFMEIIPEFRNKQLIEVGNVILKQNYRGNIALGLLLYEAAKQAWQRNYDYIVGVTRYQVLRHFVEFGVIPVLHEPLHLLGKQKLMDFIIYYDTHSPDSIRYMEERCQRFFHQEQVMAAIRQLYIH